VAQTRRDTVYVLTDDSSQTAVPLPQACVDGHLARVKGLPEGGFDPEVRDGRGRPRLPGHPPSAASSVISVRICGPRTTRATLRCVTAATDHSGATPLVLARRRGVKKDAVRLLEASEEQELQTFNRGKWLRLTDMGVRESRLLLGPRRRRNKVGLFSLRTIWRDFVEDLGFWPMLLLLLLTVIALLSLGIAYYVSGVLHLPGKQPELIH
ncbi:ankyrin repeat domain-containing protein 46-like, partial [Scleropages formosus]